MVSGALHGALGRGLWGGGQADEGVGMGAPNREARFELPFTATEMASRPINLFIVLLWNQKLSAVFLWGVQGGD